MNSEPLYKDKKLWTTTEKYTRILTFKDRHSALFLILKMDQITKEWKIYQVPTKTNPFSLCGEYISSASGPQDRPQGRNYLQNDKQTSNKH